MSARAKKIRDKERKRYEAWFRYYWGGLTLKVDKMSDEYEGTPAQIGWEVWWRFTRADFAAADLKERIKGTKRE